MYKVASRKSATAAHRGKITDWHNGEQRLTAEEQRDSLVSKVKSLRAELDTTKCKARRKEIGREINAFNLQINELRPKIKKTGAGQHFIDAAREILPKASFNAIMKLATIRATNTCIEDLREL